MSDITYPRKADALTELEPDGVSERLALAHVYATQGVAKALRELDAKLKYVADQIARSVRPDEKPERWITWGETGQRIAVAVAQIETFEENQDGTYLRLMNGTTFQSPVSYGTVAMMVGA